MIVLFVIILVLYILQWFLQLMVLFNHLMEIEDGERIDVTKTEVFQCFIGTYFIMKAYRGYKKLP